MCVFVCFSSSSFHHLGSLQKSSPVIHHRLLSPANFRVNPKIFSNLSTSPIHLTYPPHLSTSPIHLTYPPHLSTSPIHLTYPPHLSTSPIHLTYPPHLSTSPIHLTYPPHLSTSPIHLTYPPHLSTSPIHLTYPPHLSTSPIHHVLMFLFFFRVVSSQLFAYKHVPTVFLLPVETTPVVLPSLHDVSTIPLLYVCRHL